MIGVTSTLSQILELIICADEDDVSECANATLKTVAADCIACIYDTCIHSGEYANGARASMSHNLHSRRRRAPSSMLSFVGQVCGRTTASWTQLSPIAKTFRRLDAVHT